MSPVYRALILLAVTLTVSACQTPRIAPEKLATIRSVAVARTADNSWRWEQTGLVNGSKQILPGDDWRLAERATRLTSTLLAQRYTLIPADTFDAKAISGYTWETETKVGEQLAKFPKRPDVLVLIRTGFVTYGNTVLNAPTSMFGLGVYSTTHLFETYISIYAILDIDIYDGQSGKRLLTTHVLMPGTGSQDRGTPFHFLNYPGKSEIVKTWTDKFEAQPAAVQATVRSVFNGFIDASIPFTLRKIELIR